MPKPRNDPVVVRRVKVKVWIPEREGDDVGERPTVGSRWWIDDTISEVGQLHMDVLKLFVRVLLRAERPVVGRQICI